MDVIRSTVSFYVNLWVKRKDFDACREWSSLMSKMFVVSQPLSMLNQNNINFKRSRMSFFFLCLLFFTGIRFAVGAFLDREDDSHLLHVFGAMFHTLGFGGKILYISASSAFTGVAVNRTILWLKERRGRLYFLTRLTNESNPSKSLLDDKFRPKFVRIMSLNFWISVCTEIGLNTIVIFIIISCLVYAIWETNDPVVITIWVVWHFVTWPAAMVVLNDMIIISATWLMCRLHLDVQLSQLESNLLTCKGNVKRKDFHRIFKHFFKDYEKVVDRIREFDETSSLLIWSMTYTTTLLNSSLMYAVISMGSTFVGYQFLCLWLAFTPASLTLLFSATSIARKGKQIYRHLNSIHVRQNNLLNFEEKIMMRHLIEHTGNQRTPSITLFNAGSIPYDTYSFCEYVSSTVLTFLICVDFLDEALA